MSARSRRLVIAPEAESDLLDVLLYTEQNWGQQQQRAYMQQFSEAFAKLRRFPSMGLSRPEIGEGIRSHRVGQHVVVYRPSDTELRIVRVLHVHQDLDAALGQ